MSRGTVVVLEASAMVHALVGEQRHPMTQGLGRMLDLRDNFTVYDAAYIVLAQALDAALVTSDEKLNEARRLGVDVRIFPQR